MTDILLKLYAVLTCRSCGWRWTDAQPTNHPNCPVCGAKP